MRKSPLFSLVVFAFAGAGCIKSALINGQIEGTRQASVAFDSIGDFELAYYAASSGIVQFEGMHELSPDNTDALFLLTKAWTGYAYGFVEDDMERAEDDGSRDLADYHKHRAVAAYDRAIKHGLALLAHSAEGFDDVKGAEPGLKAWLEKSFSSPSDAENLFWVGYAWLARTNLLKDDAVAVADLFVGVAMLERSAAIDPTYNFYSAQTALASYHARAAMGELDEAKKLFDEILEKTQHKSLIVQFNYATKLACARADNVLYGKLLNEVLAAEDPDPNQRLTNTLAKRKARRWLAEKRTFDACSMDPAPAPTEEKNAS